MLLYVISELVGSYMLCISIPSERTPTFTPDGVVSPPFSWLGTTEAFRFSEDHGLFWTDPRCIDRTWSYCSAAFLPEVFSCHDREQKPLDLMVGLVELWGRKSCVQAFPVNPPKPQLRSLARSDVFPCLHAAFFRLCT
jgi:hypothetical protein